MKKIIPPIIAFVALIIGLRNPVKAQDAWTQGRNGGIYSVGIGGANGIVVGPYLDYYYYRHYYNPVSSTGLSINVSGEYKVWQFIGVGWESGLNIYPYAYRYVGYTGYTGIEIPFIAKGNVHIMDAAHVSIADKLDVYAGLELGAGPVIYLYPGAAGAYVRGIIHVGPQVGVRYWVTKQVAVFGEFGWGNTFANIGVTF